MATLKAVTAGPADAHDLAFAVVDPDHKDGARLRRAMEDEASRLYHDRDGSIHAVSASAAELRPPSGAFILARAGGRAIGCGGFKRLDADACEIKRMYLEPAWRGRGLARDLLEAIEDTARTAGYSLARLDTGDRQPAAERLYDGAGYRRIPDYNSNPLARHWFERELERRVRRGPARRALARDGRGDRRSIRADRAPGCGAARTHCPARGEEDAVDATVPAAAGDLTVRRSYEQADGQAIVDLHRRVYPPEYGVDESFVDDIVATLADLEARGFPGPGDGAWLVEGGEGLAGSLILSDEGDGEGKVRLFVFDRALRGRGLGRRLLDELLALARASGYERLTLSTFSDLRAAARLYREAGFVVVREDVAPRWGRADFNYQQYELRL